MVRYEDMQMSDGAPTGEELMEAGDLLDIKLLTKPSSTSALLLPPSRTMSNSTPVTTSTTETSKTSPVPRFKTGTMFVNHHSTERAGIITVSVHKSSPSARIGLRMMEDEEGCFVSHIESDGLLSGTPIRCGDRVLGVNHRPCETVEDMCRLLREPSDTFAIAVEPTGGDTDLVQAMVRKDKDEDSLGLDLRVAPDGSRPRLEIVNIHDTSPFIRSSLKKGDRLVAINYISVAHLEEDTVQELMNDLPADVTVLAQTKDAVERQKQEGYTPELEVGLPYMVCDRDAAMYGMFATLIGALILIFLA